MRIRSVTAIAGLVLLTVAAGSAQAGWLKRVAKAWHTEFRRSLVWPEPFLQQDREAVWAPLTTMVYNGWRDQNTLTDEHFKEGTAELNQAGRNKVWHIVSRVPDQFRAVFVLQGESPESTAERIAHVQQVAAELSTEAPPPEVFETQTAPDNWPADYVNAVEGKFIESTPAPRLPEVSGSSSSSSSSGS